MSNLVKLVSRYFKAKFEPGLVRFILPFFKKIRLRICIMENIFYGQQIIIKPKNSTIIKTNKNLVSRKVYLIYKLSFSTIFSFINFSCSSYIFLGVKDTKVIGLPFILMEYIFVSIMYNSLIILIIIYQTISDYLALI